MFLTAPVLAQKTTGISMKWEIAAELPAGNGQKASIGFAGTVNGVHNDVLLIAGGANFPEAMPWQGGKKKYYNNIVVYGCKQRKLTLTNKSFTLPEPVAYAASCNTTNGILYAGGENQNGISNKVRLMIWDVKSQQVLFKELPSLPLPVTNASAVFVGETVYIAGGETAAGVSLEFLALNLNNTAAGWKQLAEIPEQVSHTILVASAGKENNAIYLCGGRKKNSNGISDLYNKVYAYNISSNSWQEKQPMPYALSAGTGSFYDANNIILFGGDKGTVFTKVETLIAAIAAEKDEEKKQVLIADKNKLQSEHPGFSNEILLYNIKTNTWKIIGNIPFDTPVTTSAVKWKSRIIIPSGEIRAGVRSPKILEVKIKKGK